MSAANPTLSPETQTSYALDVAFSSNTQPLPGNSKNPILAMGYGFSSLAPGGSWKEGGQKAQGIFKGSPVYFCAYDTASTGGQPLKEIKIHFKSGATPFWDPQTKEPVGDPIVVNEGLTSMPGQSAGCNVVGTLWLIGPYTVSDNALLHTPYECVVTVKVADDNTFQIDPEMVVDGPGIDPAG